MFGKLQLRLKFEYLFLAVELGKGELLLFFSVLSQISCEMIPLLFNNSQEVQFESIEFRFRRNRLLFARVGSVAIGELEQDWLELF